MVNLRLKSHAPSIINLSSSFNVPIMKIIKNKYNKRKGKGRQRKMKMKTKPFHDFTINFS
jgi:hypothetical protein